MYKGKIFTDKEQLKKDYEELSSCNKIALKYGVNPKTVYALMNHYGLKRNDKSQNARKHKYDENFFETIDTEEKAYWLGFIMADGCVYNGSDANSLRLQINLKGSDKDHLEKFQKSIKSNYKIQLKDVNGSPVSLLKVNSTKMCKDLMKLNVVQRKSIICEYPKINKKFDRHFIRGYFDGDGCLSIYNRGERICYSFSIVGGEKMLKTIQEKIPYTVRFYKSNKHNVDTIETGAKEDVVKILDWLYKNATIYLGRKYSKYKELKAIK